MNWLEKIKPFKPYRYLFHKLYHFTMRLSSDIPQYSAMLVMAVTILFQGLVLFDLVGIVIGENMWLKYISGSSKIAIGFFMVIFLLVNHFFFTYKEKWKRFIAEFEEENRKNKRVGAIILYLYLFVSILGFYALHLWLVTWNNPNWG